MLSILFFYLILILFYTKVVAFNLQKMGTYSFVCTMRRYERSTLRISQSCDAHVESKK